MLSLLLPWYFMVLTGGAGVANAMRSVKYLLERWAAPAMP